MGTAVFLGKSRATVCQVQNHLAGMSSRWVKPDSGGNALRHAESMEKPGST
jgi:hypothetical protein